MTCKTDCWTLRRIMSANGYVGVHKFFTIKSTKEGHFWDYGRKKKGKYYSCWSEKFGTFESCLEDLQDFYKRLYSSQNEENVITSQIVKVRLLEKINPGRRVGYEVNEII